MTFIKICGITNINDAQAAIDMGADALGFIFAESPRKVTPETARNIISQLPSNCLYIGVFVNHSKEDIISIKDYCGLSTVQLHDDISLSPDEFHTNSHFPIIRAIRVKPDEPIPQSINSNVMLLLDTYSKTAHGGTGQTFDWQKAVPVARKRPVILAGGLKPDNVALAVETVQPFAVDVSSGVEKSKGIKDHLKIQAFIDNVRQVDSLLEVKAV